MPLPKRCKYAQEQLLYDCTTPIVQTSGVYGSGVTYATEEMSDALLRQVRSKYREIPFCGHANAYVSVVGIINPRTGLNLVAAFECQHCKHVQWEPDNDTAEEDLTSVSGRRHC